MNKFIDVTGQVFARLSVIKLLDERNKVGKLLFLCECECGALVKVDGKSLRSGNTKSCGCYQKDKVKNIETTHGESVKGTVSVEYATWQHIKDRCHNPRCKGYKNYGARSIVVCDEWRYSFEKFLEDMGRRPAGRYSLDRIDVNGNYCPENCRWLPLSEQVNNRRCSVLYEYNGEFLTLTGIAKKLNLNGSSLIKKVRTGMQLHEAIHYLQKIKNSYQEA